MISILSDLLRFDLWPRIWSSLENVLWDLEKNMYLECVFCYYCMQCSINASETLSLNSSTSLLFFGLVILSIVERGVLKSQTTILYLSISSSSSVSFCFTQFAVLFLGAYTFKISMSYWWIDPFYHLQCLCH